MKLVPAIIQDEKSGDVLSLFWMDSRALQKTKKTGKVWRYSRSKQKVIMKGAISGNLQKVKAIKWDCDKDALLIEVEQTGDGACHTGNWSCFFEEKGTGGVLDGVFEVIKSRRMNAPKGSYTGKIIGSRKKITEKLEEESAEFVEAFNEKNKREVVWEAADVLYFLMVALANRKIEWEQVLGEMRRRQRQKS